jgi:hypothetical protein
MKRRDFLAGVGAIAALSSVPTAGLALPKKVRITYGIQGYPWEAEIETIIKGDISKIAKAARIKWWFPTDGQGIWMKTSPIRNDHGVLEFANFFAKQWHIMNFANLTNIIKVYEGAELRERWELHSVTYSRFYAGEFCECVLESESLPQIDSKYF